LLEQDKRTINRNEIRILFVIITLPLGN
jgi:hypothetical protein